LGRLKGGKAMSGWLHFRTGAASLERSGKPSHRHSRRLDIKNFTLHKHKQMKQQKPAIYPKKQVIYPKISVFFNK